MKPACSSRKKTGMRLEFELLCRAWSLVVMLCVSDGDAGAAGIDGGIRDEGL